MLDHKVHVWFRRFLVQTSGLVLGCTGYQLQLLHTLDSCKVFF